MEFKSFSGRFRLYSLFPKITFSFLFRQKEKQKDDTEDTTKEYEHLNVKENIKREKRKRNQCSL